MPDIENPDMIDDMIEISQKLYTSCQSNKPLFENVALRQGLAAFNQIIAVKQDAV